MTGLKRLRGLIAATYTPFHEDGSLAPEEIGPLVDRLISEGVSGLYVCGSTGEGMSCTTEEREQILEASVAAVAGRIPVIVQVGHNCIEDSCRLAAHAESVGVDAVSAVCPSYYPIGDVELLVEVMTKIADAAPTRPFYYYHIPVLSKAAFDMVEFLTIAEGRMNTLAGIKFTAPALHEYQAAVNYHNGNYDILWGVDEMLLGAWYTGARGGVGSTYNIAAPLYHRLLHACETGDHETALERQRRSVEMIRTIAKFPFHPAMKAILAMLGNDVGPARLPMKSLTEPQKTYLKRDLTELGFFDWAEEDTAALAAAGVST